MATNRNAYQNLVSNLVGRRPGIGGKLPHSILGNHFFSSPVPSAARLISGNDLRRSSGGGNVSAHPVSFGNPPAGPKASAASGGSNWPNLIQSAVTRGVASLLGGGLGLESLVSGIFSLFASGKKKAAAPLIRFQLPASQNATLYAGGGILSSTAHFTPRGQQLNQGGASDIAGNVLQSTQSGPTSSRAMASSTGHSVLTESNIDSQWFVDRSNDIAKAVKEAMLNSHALNDVIAEI